VSNVPIPDTAKYLARLDTETLQNGNELECSGFTITSPPLKQKFLRSPTGVTPSRSVSTTGGRIPQDPRHNIHSKTKRIPGNHSKTPYIYIYIRKEKKE
jgi:hypothetical protein